MNSYSRPWDERYLPDRCSPSNFVELPGTVVLVTPGLLKDVVQTEVGPELPYIQF